jgi:hypothetical protein
VLLFNKSGKDPGSPASTDIASSLQQRLKSLHVSAIISHFKEESGKSIIEKHKRKQREQTYERMSKGKEPGPMQLQLRSLQPQGCMLRMSPVSLAHAGAASLLISR